MGYTVTAAAVHGGKQIRCIGIEVRAVVQVTCGFCRSHMCWTCEQVITGYEHFRQGCVLFNEAQLLAWEGEWDRMVADQAAGAAGGGARRREQRVEGAAARAAALRCPRCGRANAKRSRNNHVKCVTCMTDACFVCRSVLQGPRAVRAHFGGTGGCPQHS